MLWQGSHGHGAYFLLPLCEVAGEIGRSLRELNAK